MVRWSYLPVSDTGEDLALDIFLNISPGLAFYWGLGGQEFSQVTRLYGGHDIPLVKVVIVAGNCISVSEMSAGRDNNQKKSSRKSRNSLSSMAVAAASRKPRESILKYDIS